MFQKYTDTEMGKYFGWRVSAVGDRREEYDLTSDKDLQNKVFNGQAQPQSYDSLKLEKENLEEQLEIMKKQLSEQEERINTKIDIMMIGMQELNKISKKPKK
jgi:Tfp pilus assembly protein PilO